MLQSVVRSLFNPLITTLLAVSLVGAAGPTAATAGPLEGGGPATDTTRPPASSQGDSLAVGDSLPTMGAVLRRLDGSSVSPRDLAGSEGTVLVFWSNRCPWVDRYEERLAQLVQTYQTEGVRFVRVNAVSPATQPEEARTASQRRAERLGYATPYVHDTTGTLAQTLGAKRVPHAFVFDDAMRLRYAGAIDDSPADTTTVEAAHLDRALEALTQNGSVPTPRTRAFGCMLNTIHERNASR
jgi:thiol-disulfide isomerase/thioredoxin